MSAALSGTRYGSVSGGLLFGLLCVVWGSTWLALKLGVSMLPPLSFAAARFLSAGLVLLGLAAGRGRLRVSLATVLPGAVLMIGVNYGLMAWGLTRVQSGVASVVNFSTIPTATLILSVFYGRVRCSAGAAAALVVGAAGLTLLIGPDFRIGRFAGMAAIAAGAAAYAWGAVLTKERPAADPLALAGWQSLSGGVLIALAAVMAEPVGKRALAALAAGMAVGDLAFLALASAIGGVVYLVLLARWEPGRVAAYAYVCPLIALAEGWAAGARLPGRSGLAAILLLLIATRLSLGVTPVRGDTR